MVLAAFVLGAVSFADGVQLTFVPSNMTQKLGGYRPVRADMVEEFEGLKMPAGLTAPKYGKLDFGGKSFAFVLDEPPSGSAKLIVDSNGNSDLTDDPPASWSGRTQNGLTMFSGTAHVTLNGHKASVNMYRFDPKDPSRPQLKSTMLYYADFGFTGTATIGGKSFPIAFAGEVDKSIFIWIDRNADGRSQSRAETLSIGKPFNLGNGSYVLSIQNGSIGVAKSSTEVAEIPLPPDLRVGKLALAFSATTMNGGEVKFPESYKGKVVLLDFWATWCGPCIAELPNVTKAFETFHSKGFEILSISLDDKDMTDKVNAFTREHKMPWPQIYEGKGWECSLVQKYGVEGIPFVLLVDGDTGKILADASKLRGPQISTTIESALRAKFGG